MTNGEIFRAAAQYIRKHGWIQGAGGLHGGPRCAEGALASVAFGDGWRQLPTAWTVASARACPGGGLLRHWNDEPGREVEQVIAFFEDLAFDEDLKAAATAVSQPQNLAEPDRNCTRLTTPETGALVSQPQLVEA